MSLRDVDNMPDPEPLIEGFLMQRENAVCFGPTKLGKSFIALDACLSVATGLPALGRLKVCKVGPVLYFTGEGKGGFKKRIRAWAQEHGFQDHAKFMATVPFYFVPVVPLASDFHNELEKFFAAAAKMFGNKTPLLTVIDTKIKSMRGMNENEAGDNETYLKMCENLVSELGCTSLTVAHSGLEEGRQRGSTAADGGFDAIWQVEGNRERKVLKLSASQMKDEDGDGAYHMKLKPVIARGMRNGKTELAPEICTGR